MFKKNFFILMSILVVMNFSWASEYVYHASTKKSLKELVPSVSTHGEKWVYATKYLGMVAAFLGRWDDFDLFQGSCGDSINIFLVERYKGAFQKVYGNSKGGSIYKLDATGFLSGMTGYSLEVVNPSTVPVIEEIVIDSPWDYLKKIENKGELKLYYFPDRPSCIPANDQDLIDKAVKWIRKGHIDVKGKFLKLHPKMRERLEKALGVQTENKIRFENKN